MTALTWETLAEGQELDPLVNPAISKTQLVMYAGASGDFNLIHTDVETAQSVGLAGTIAHGMLSMGFLGQYVGHLIGTQGFVQQLKVKFSEMVFPGDVLTCRGRVLTRDEAARTVKLAVLAERDGKPVTAGVAILAFTY